jgi:O-antigen/teichoic acid export membrane protein
MDNIKRYVAKSFGWSVIAKIINSLIQFVSVPLLLTYFGKENFGLITLAISVNAYLSILEMGVNTGGVKFYSEWIEKKNFMLLDSVARTSITFYGLIGIVNSIILIIIAFWGMHFFQITVEQASVLNKLFLILAMFTVINWCTSVFNQLIIANEGFYYIQQVNIVKNFLILLLLWMTIKFHFDLTIYFIWFSIINSIIVVPLYLKSKKNLLIKNFIPAFDWDNFAIVLKYSLAIIAMSIFQMSASQLRPVILSLYSTTGIGILSEYRIMETICLFIISIGGIFTSIFLPKTSKLLLENDKERIDNFAYNSTLYISIICVILALPFVLSGKEILTVYVGSEFNYLFPWLVVWIFSIIFQLHSSPVASLILATGKTKMLVYSSAIACVISLFINAVFTSWLGVGSAILGYAVYIVIQISFYYLYFNNKVLNLNSWKIFRSFIIPTLLGVIAMGIVLLMNIQFSNLIIFAVLKTSIWFALFFGLLLITKTINFKELRGLVSSLRK